MNIDSQSLGRGLLVVFAICFVVALVLTIAIVGFINGKKDNHNYPRGSNTKTKYPLIRAMIIGVVLALLTFAVFFGLIFLSSST